VNELDRLGADDAEFALRRISCECLLAAGRKRRALASWLIGLENKFGDRVLAIDAETARVWGELTARAQKSGEIIPAVDGLLAATARRHSLHVMTRNTRYFEASGALVFDPWG
jgi:toxin FitB